MSTRFSTGSSERTAAEPDAAGVPDAIQSSGFALVLDHDWMVRRVSANIDRFLTAVAPADCLGRPLADVLGGDAVHSLRNRIALMRPPSVSTRLFACHAGSGNQLFDFIVRDTPAHVLIEGRPAAPAEHGDSAEVVRALIARLNSTGAAAKLLGEAALQLRAMTGYDRVACYGFGGDDPGMLVAQSARNMGPAPERLPDWFRPATRLLIDGDPLAVSLVPEANSGATVEALFGAVTSRRRSWLEARGALAAMAVSLPLGGERWGTIVCDHPSARRVTVDRQAAFELYADMLALKVEIAELRTPTA